MSLVSIYVNKDKIKNCFDYIVKLPVEPNNKMPMYSSIFEKCLLSQYEMMRKNFNINMIKKRHFTSNLKGYELLDALYQHIFIHNYVALNDEYGEIAEAMDKAADKYDSLISYFEATNNIDHQKDNDYFMARLLSTEETIDAFHFIMEYIILTEELYQIIVGIDIPSLTINDLEYLYVDCSDDNIFYNNVKEMLKKEATHLADEIENYLFTANKEDCVKECYDDSFGIVYANMMCNRNFIRQCNFKDWKEYDIKNFYTQGKFAELFEYTRTMIKNLFEIIVTDLGNFAAVHEMIETEPELRDDPMYILYAIYIAKHDENIRRQNDDPRYKLNGKGIIVGNEVH